MTPHMQRMIDAAAENLAEMDPPRVVDRDAIHMIIVATVHEMSQNYEAMDRAADKCLARFDWKTEAVTSLISDSQCEFVEQVLEGDKP